MIKPKLSDSEQMRSAKRLRTCLPQAGKKFAKTQEHPKSFVSSCCKSF